MFHPTIISAPYYSNINNPLGLPGGLVNPYKFHAYLNTVQQITASSGMVKVHLDAEAFDPNNNFNTSTNRYTVPVSGYYHMDYQTSSANGANDELATVVRKNGTSTNLVYYSNKNGSAVATQTVGNSSLLYLSAGDYLELFASTTFSSNMDINYGQPFYTFMSCYLVSAT